MTISVAIKLNGGAAGAPYQATAGEAITATLDSVAGVNSVQWSVTGGDDLVSAASYTLVTSGVKGETCATNASATAGTAFILQAVVNADPTLYARAKVWVPANNGLEVGADGELYEGDATHGTARVQNEAIRASGVGAQVPQTRLITTTAPLRIGGGASADLSADRTLSITLAAPSVTVKSEATAAGAGVATSALRSDVQFQAATAAPSIKVLSDNSTFTQGTASTLLRSDCRLIADTDTPVAIGTSNDIGVSVSLAAADHLHDHGAQTVDTHHALAVAGVSHGFLDKADKTKLDGITAGAAVASVSGTAPIVSSGGTTPAISISAASGAAAGSMSAAHYTLVNDATATPTASKIAKWDASVYMGATRFYGAGTVATAGLLAAANNVVVASARNAANGANIALLTTDGTDKVTVGDAANASAVDVSALTTLRTMIGAAVSTHATANGLSIGLAPSFGSGVGMVGIANAATEPTTAPTGCVLAYPFAGATKIYTPKQVRTTLAPESNSAATDQRLDQIHASLHTTDATVTIIKSYTLPTACAAIFRILITAQQTGTDSRAAFTYDVCTGRAAGGAAVDAAPTVVTLIDNIAAVGAPTVVASGNDIQFKVTGKAGTDIDWCITSTHVHLFSV